MTFALFVDDTLAAVFVTYEDANTARALCLCARLLGRFCTARIEESDLDAVYDNAFDWFSS